MPVQVQNGQGVPVQGALVRRVAERALRALGMSGAELSIVLVDDARMRALNRRYRRQDRTTDVLAFPQVDGRSPMVMPVLLGDVVVSVETVVRRVGPAPRRLHGELVRSLCHGLLHLAGWDHHTGSARRQMRGRERALWKTVWGDRHSGRVSDTRSRA